MAHPTEGMPLRVVGLDLSLLSTGVSDGSHHFAIRLPSQEVMPLEPRLVEIRSQLRMFVGLNLTGGRGVRRAADLVLIEAPAFSKALQTSHEELSGLRVMVRLMLWDMGIPFALVTPTGLKMYTTGHGKATKAMMGQAIAERHGIDFADRRSPHYVTLKEGRGDIVDAFALAAMGYARLEQPLPTQGPPAPLKSLLAVDWPPMPDPR